MYENVLNISDTSLRILSLLYKIKFNVYKSQVITTFCLTHPTSHGKTPLHDAAIQGNIKLTDLLIRNNADMKATDNMGRTPLHDAAMKGNTKLTDLLIRNNAEVNATDNVLLKGESGLHQSASKGEDNVAKDYVSLGADVSAVDNKFEKIANNLKWPVPYWTTMLQSVFEGKAAEIYSAIPSEKSSDYDTVKQEVLKAYELVPEAYRQTFRSYKKFDSQTYVEFA
ncbi:poly [ADP-ribose] polymerase tankyrase-2-like [Mytilus trossulus]|uniref:poly [ADP-ribose] polymerase tankyrase-2-like n=1 Tax=Mytilus trossulus TaxID=6551 RepID=UPI003003C13D